jgi:polyisoprenoid-binding protein YceI
MNRIFLVTSLAALFSACTDPARGKPRAEVAPAPAPAPRAAAPAALEGAVPYLFSEAGSKLTWTGAKVSLKHPGGFNTFSGTVDLVDGDPTKSRVSVEIDMNSVFSDSEKLVGHLKSPDFFDVAQFPRSTFVSERIAAKADAPGTFDVSGTFTLHGVSKRITFPASIAVEGDVVKAKAEFAINRKDFGIVYPGKPDDLIADDVVIGFEINAARKG